MSLNLLSSSFPPLHYHTLPLQFVSDNGTSIIELMVSLHFTTTLCLSLRLQPVSDNGISIMIVIELMVSSSFPPLHYHTLCISTAQGVSDNGTSIMNVIELIVFIFPSTSLPHFATAVGK